MVDNHHELHQVMHELRNSGLKLARKPKDRFRVPTNVGYRDALTHWVMPNGHIAEVQLHVKSMMLAKAIGHEHYEKVNEIKAKVDREGRHDPTPEESKQLTYHEGEQKRIYGAAWRESLPQISKAIGRTHVEEIGNKGVRYYDWNDRPAYQTEENGMRYVLKNGTWVGSWDTKYLLEACPISKSEFEKLIEEQMRIWGKDADERDSPKA